MTTSFDRDPSDPTQVTVNFDCPWCNAHQVAQASFLAESAKEVWLLMLCASARCHRPSFLRVPLESNNGAIWSVIRRSDPRLNQHGELEIHPSPRPTYEATGVPAKITRDFQEALQCHACGFRFGAALVGRRVLQAAVRDRLGAKGKNLEAEINSLPMDVLNTQLKTAAHEVRFVGNEAAHAAEVTEEDVDALLDFTLDVLDSLYVLPARLAARRRPKAKP